MERMQAKFPTWWGGGESAEQFDKEALFTSFMTFFWMLIAELAVVSQTREKAVIPLSSNVSACLFVERGKEKGGAAFIHAHIIFRSVNGLRGSHLWADLFSALLGVPNSVQVQVAIGESDARKNRCELYLTSLDCGKFVDTTPAIRGAFRFRASTVDLQKIQLARAKKAASSFSVVCDWVDSPAAENFANQLEMYQHWCGKVKTYLAFETVEEKLLNFQAYKLYFGLRNWYSRLGSRASAELSCILETRVAISMVHMRDVEIADQVEKVIKLPCRCEENKERDGRIWIFLRLVVPGVCCFEHGCRFRESGMR